MELRDWEKLPRIMKCEDVKQYYDILSKKKLQLRLKRGFDFLVSLIMLLIFAFPMVVIGFLIKLDSPGPVFYRQERVTSYGRRFRIHKFRTMVQNADKIGTEVTIGDDFRITKVGKKIRGYRLDELPQLIDVLLGDMSFVGTRPEATKYVKNYSKEMLATLLLPAGITSEASIRYKDEAELLMDAENADDIYVNKILPEKMEYNLESIKRFSFLGDIITMFRTVLAVFGKEYK